MKVGERSFARVRSVGEDIELRLEVMRGIQVLTLRLQELSKSFPTSSLRSGAKFVAYNGIGKLDWGFGPAGEEAIVTGSDVLVMKGDKIGALYTFVDPPKK